MLYFKTYRVYIYIKKLADFCKKFQDFREHKIFFYLALVIPENICE